MGAIIRRGTTKRPRFYLRFLDADGKRKMRAAKGAVNVQHARRMLAEIERRIFGGEIGIKEVTEQEQARRSITVAELGAKFIEQYTSPKRIKDIEAYRKSAKSKFKVRVDPLLGSRSVNALTVVDLERFRDQLAEKPLELEPASIKNTLALLSKLFVWGKRQGHVDCDSPVKGVERPTSMASIDYLDRDEVERLLACAERFSGIYVASHEVRDVYPMIATALYTGLRKGELFGLRWTDVHFSSDPTKMGRLDVMRSYTRAPKSGKARHVAINPELGHILRAWKERCPKTDDGLVFPVDGKMGTGYDMLGIRDLLALAGCHDPEKPWHALRHTFASHFMMSGGNILTLQKLLGHGTLTMTLVYAHLAPDFMAAEIARMSFAPSVPAGVSDIGEARREAVVES